MKIRPTGYTMNYLYKFQKATFKDTILMSKNRLNLLKWIFIPFLLFLWANPAWAVLYKWKDEKGQHFTDDITKVPLKFRPAYTNKKPKKKTEKPKTSLNKNPTKKRTTQNQKKAQGMQQFPEGVNPDMEQIAEELMRGLGESMEQMAEEMGKTIEDIGPAVGN